MITRRSMLAAAGSILAAPSLALGERAVQNGPVHDGIEVDVDLPRLLRVRNGRGVDGAGLCVWATVQMLANYHNCTSLRNIFEQMTHERGGGWPDRLEKEMRRRGLEDQYRQHLGTDFGFVRGALAEGRPVGITYGYGEDYRGTIAHWVVCVGWSKGKVAVLDDNYINYLSWMSEDEFKRRALHPGGSMWAAYLLWPLPPSPPRN